MKSTPTTPLSHRREAIRLWFEFLHLATNSQSKEVKEALRRNEEFYHPWEIASHRRFDGWWSGHRHLFEERYVVRALKAGEPPLDPKALILEIPLTRSPTELTKIIKGLIQDAVDKSERTGRKSKKRPSSVYTLSDGSEPKLRAVREMLSVYKNVRVKHPKLKSEKLLKEVQRYYMSRKDKRWRIIPSHFLYREGDGDDTARALRNLNRYIQRAEKIILNVANAQFPGRY
jgi:hypothetical protein